MKNTLSDAIRAGIAKDATRPGVAAPELLVLNEDEAVALLRDLDVLAPEAKTRWTQVFAKGRRRVELLVGELAEEIAKRHGGAIETELQKATTGALELAVTSRDAVTNAVALAKQAVSEAQRIGRAYDALAKAPAMVAPFRTTTAMRAAVPSVSPAAVAELEQLSKTTTDPATAAQLKAMAARANASR